MTARSGTTESTVQELIAKLHDPDELVRLHAALQLGSRGAAARPALPALVGLLRYGDLLDRRGAAWALRDLGDRAAEAVPALCEALADEDSQVRTMATQALEAIRGADATHRARRPRRVA